MNEIDLGEYYRKEIADMERNGMNEEEIMRRLDSMERIQKMVVAATL